MQSMLSSDYFREKSEDQAKPVNLLWSGGFDSTYRLLTLLQEKRRVHTVYVEGLNPEKQDREEAARAQILAVMPSEMRAFLVERTGLKRSDWEPQYMHHKLGIEQATGLEVGPDISPQGPMMPAMATLISETVECCYVATDQANKPDVLKHMAAVEFPLIKHTKQEMLLDAKQCESADEFRYENSR